MVIVMTFCSLVAINSNAANDSGTKDVKPETPTTVQESSLALRVDVIGTSGTQSFTGVEEGDYLSVSGVGNALTISVQGGSNETIPSPTGPQVIQVIEMYMPWGNGKWARVNVIFDDGDLIGIDVLEWDSGCPC